jgi:subtilisin family serine protease
MAVIGLASIGLPVAAAGHAGASVPVASHRFGAPTSVHRVAPRPRESVLAMAARAKIASVQPASVAPVSQLFPACYGDSRNISGFGGSLRPASFGAFYSCTHHAWTFEVQTADTWAKNSLGVWGVFIDTDGNFNDSCGGFEYLAFVEQTPTTGDFTGGVQASTGDPTGQNCTFGNVIPGTITITGNSAAISFAWTAINSSPSLAWNGLLQNRTEEMNGGGDEVPNANFVDGPLTGGILDSIPGPTPSACTAPGPNGPQSATTSDSHRAVVALRRAGFANVHDYGEGVVAFTGDSARAEKALSAAGVGVRISRSEPFTPAGGTTTAPDDTNFGSQWNLAAINATGAWAVTTGSNVVVADVDTGVDFTQSDLSSPQLVPGIDETGATPVGINYASGNTDSDGHGTAVAGAIAAATNNSNLLASLGWNTSVMPVKVDFTNAQVDSQIAAGIDWAADNTTNPVRVINLSLGGPCPDAAVQTAIQHAQSKGILVVAAAGNEALSAGFDPTPSDLAYNDAPSYPAAFSGVLAVGATGRDGSRAAYSNTGPYVAVMAPGGSADGTAADDISLLKSGGTTTTEAGTSFAAPQVAAAAALILSVNPALTPSQISELITGSAGDLGPPGADIEYGNGILNASAALADTPSATSGYGTFYSLAPSRILDTRHGLGAPQAKVGTGNSINVTVDGRGAIPATGVAAVVLNVTVTDPTAPSFVTVWPTGQTRPNASNINFTAGQTVPNLVTVKVGSGGQVSLYNSAGSTDLIADVAGYYGDGSAAAGSTFVPLSPDRLLDTRTTGGPVAGGATRNLAVAGASGVPVPSDATAVVVNVTVTGPTAKSYVTAYPQGASSPPTASNLNFIAGQTVPNLVTVEVGSGGGVSFFNEAGSVQVIVDLEGYFTAIGNAGGSRFFPVVDHRIVDTRANIGGFFTPIGAGQAIAVAATGHGGVIDGAAALVMNTTATGPTAVSYLTVYPNGTTRPNASNLNFVTGLTVANLVSGKIGTGGDVDLYNRVGSVQAIADVAGWYGAPGT